MFTGRYRIQDGLRNEHSPRRSDWYIMIRKCKMPFILMCEFDDWSASPAVADVAKCGRPVPHKRIPTRTHCTEIPLFTCR
jgi:hypothetical protein